MTSAGHALTIEPKDDGTALVACEWPERVQDTTMRSFSGTWRWRRGTAALELPVTITLKRRRPLFLPDLFEDEKWVHVIVLEARASEEGTTRSAETPPLPRDSGGSPSTSSGGRGASEHGKDEPEGRDAAPPHR